MVTFNGVYVLFFVFCFSFCHFFVFYLTSICSRDDMLRRRIFVRVDGLADDITK